MNETFTVQTTALIQGSGCRESTHPVSGCVLGMISYAVVKFNGSGCKENTRPVSGQVQRALLYAVVNCNPIDTDHRRKLRQWFMEKSDVRERRFTTPFERGGQIGHPLKKVQGVIISMPPEIQRL
ncbi:MAG: hypothetical protein IJZ72_10380 [Oscillospiraceae bacterium]|nr:hypothetical protein [Oscillospiraceae bacterium]